MKRAAAVLASLALSVGLLATVLAGPASAVSAVVTSPVDGTADGWGLDRFTIDVAEPGDVVWSLRSDDGLYAESDWVRVEAGPVTITTDPVQHAGSYTLVLQDLDDRVLDSVAFTATSPPGLSDPAASPATFYPYVVDGYRDETTFSFRTGTTLVGVSFAVFTAGGDVVRRERIGTRYRGPVRWRWDGRTGSGHLLVAGDYRIEATARTADRRTIALTSPVVTSATTAEKKRVRAVRLGADASSTARTGACRVTPDSRDRLGLVCRTAGPRAQARATYDFRLPTAVPGTVARDIRWLVDGRSGNGGRGTVELSGRKVAADRFRVEVRVLGDRSYLVRSVVLTYTAYVGR